MFDWIGLFPNPNEECQVSSLSLSFSLCVLCASVFQSLYDGNLVGSQRQYTHVDLSSIAEQWDSVIAG